MTLTLPVPVTHAAPPANAPAIRDFPPEERPRERLRRYGPGHLSNAELIAILFRTGMTGENVVAMATRLLARTGGLSGLARITFDDLIAERGVSEAKACQLLAGLELGKRVASLAPDDRPQIGGPADLANLLMAEMSALDREHLRVVLLNTKHQVMGVEELYSGSVNSALVRPAEVFASAIRKNCPAIAIVHNHPSGDPAPSEDDIKITKQIDEAGALLEVELVDHIVIAQGRWVSMRERRLGFSKPAGK